MNEKLGKFITKKPKFTIALIVIITILMMLIYNIPDTFGQDKKDVESENDWLPDNKYVIADNEINENYGIQVSYLQIIVEGKNENVLTKNALIDILEVEKKVSENKNVQNILIPSPGNISSISSSLANVDKNKTYDEMLEILNNFDQKKINEILSKNEKKIGMFLTKDFSENLKNGNVKAKGTMILIMLNSKKYDEIQGDNNPILDADNDIREIIETSEFKGIKRMGIVEEEYVNQQINEESGDVMGFLFQMVFLLIIIILFLTYRSVFDTIICLLALMFAIIWMNGIGVILGLTFSAMYEAVPIMIMGLGIDYGIHLVMRYREERTQYNKKIGDALILTTVSVGAALFLATLTTGISFGSNTVSEIKPMREFSIFALVGIVSAFIVMVTFIPAIKMVYHSWQEKRGKKEFKKLKQIHINNQEQNNQINNKNIKKNQKKNKHTGTDTLLTRTLAKGAIAAEHHAYPVIIVVVILSLICAGLSMKLTTEFDFTEFLPDNTQIKDDIVYLTDNFGFGTEESNILINAKIDDSDILKAIAKTENNIRDNPNVNEQNPINSILTLMNDTANEGGEIEKNETFSNMYKESDSDDDGVPDKNIIDLFNFLMFNEDYKQEVKRVLHFNNETEKYDGAVIRVGVNSQNGGKAKEIYENLHDDIKPLEDEKKVDNTTATSGPILIHVIIHSIEQSGLKSLLITVIVAGIILTIVFYVTDRSLILGILTEIPVILVIAWVFASIYFLGMSLNVMTIMIASLTVGLGITYGIHVTHRFVEDLNKFDSIDDACRSTVTNTGAALFGAAITTIGGFGILIFAPIPPLKKFGAISSLAILFSLIASVFVLPTFLSLWAKYVKKKDPCYFKNHTDIQHMIEKNALSCKTAVDKEKREEKTEENKKSESIENNKKEIAENKEEKTKEKEKNEITKADEKEVISDRISDDISSIKTIDLKKDESDKNSRKNDVE